MRDLGNLLDHSPNDIDVREARLDALNRRYLDVSTEFDWLFLQTEADWYVWKDIVQGTDTAITVSVTNDNPLVTFSASLNTVNTNSNAKPLQNGEAVSFTQQNAAWEFLDGLGRIYTFNSLDGATGYLDSPYTGSTAAALTGWTVRCRHFFLPVDCTRPLGFVDRVNGLGRMVVLDRRREELYLSSQSDTSGTIYWIVEDDAVYDRAPDPGWTATDSAGAGSLAASTTYEYCYTFVRAPAATSASVFTWRESPPSPPLRVTTSSAAQHTIQIASLEDTRDVAGNATGILKNIYRRILVKNGTNVYGRWQFVAQRTESQTTFDDDDSPAALLSDFDALRYTNGRKWMRTKWIPSENATLRLRYLRMPKRLVADSDVPMWPEAFHDLLLYGAAVDLGMQHGLVEKAARWEVQFNRMLQRMKAGHLAVPDMPSRRERMNMGGGGLPPWRSGTVSGDFGG